MQSPRVYDPNDQIPLALPARLVQVVFDIFHKHPSLGLPYDTINELLVLLHTQCQPQPPAVDSLAAELRPQPDGHSPPTAVSAADYDVS